MSQTARAFADEEPEPQLFIAPNRGVNRERTDELPGVWGKIITLLGLNNRGSVLLTRCGLIVMRWFAALLIINFVFDTIAWWLLFNSILGNDIKSVGLHSAGALLGALLVATSIMIYEQQFMTADLTGRRVGLAGAIVLRIIVIGLAVLVTSQPIELLFFKGPIERRAHQEGVRLQALSLLRQLDEYREKQTKGGLAGVVQQTDYVDAVKTTDDQRGELAALQARLRNAQGRLAAIRAREAALARAIGRTPRREVRENLSRQLARVRASIPDAQTEVDKLNEEATVKTQRVAETQGKEDQAKADRDKFLNDMRQQEERVRKWVARIRVSQPSETVYENRSDPNGYVYQDTKYDFFEQLRVIDDLTHGRPARWLEASDEDIERLGKEFNFNEQSAMSQQEDAKINSSFYTKAYRAIFGIAFVIPLLLLAFKLLQPQELRDYYSLEAQKKAGNYEAMLFSTRPEPEHAQA